MPGVDTETAVPFMKAILVAGLVLPGADRLLEEGRLAAALLIGVPVAVTALVTAARAGMGAEPERPLLGAIFFCGPIAVIGLLCLAFGELGLRCVMAADLGLFGSVALFAGVTRLVFDVAYGLVLMRRGRLKSGSAVWISLGTALCWLAFGGVILAGARWLAPPSWRIGLYVWSGLVALLGLVACLRVKFHAEWYEREHAEWIRA
jgi:hypothetical protein